MEPTDMVTSATHRPCERIWAICWNTIMAKCWLVWFVSRTTPGQYQPANRISGMTTGLHAILEAHHLS